MIKNDTITEIAGYEYAYPGIIKALRGKFGDRLSSMHFSLSPKHPFFRFLLRYSHSYSVRRVWNGGHIARLAPTSKILAKMTPLFEERLREIEHAAFAINIRGQVFNWSGKKLKIIPASEGHAVDVDFDIAEWQKILLGIVSPADVNNYESSSSRVTAVMDLLFPMMWPQTSETDHH